MVRVIKGDNMLKERNIKISVIIPVYNVEQYLEKCIESVLQQKYDNYEIILVDDGATDDSGKICEGYGEKFPEKIRVIHQENKGLGGARNTGIEQAEGDYLFFVDSDDYIEQGCFEKLNQVICTYHADMVIFNMKTVDTEGNMIRRSSLDLPEGVFTLAQVPKLMFVQTSAWGKLYHRNLFLETGIRFPERKWFEDIWVAYGLFVSAQRIVKCDDVLYNYVMRSGSIMNSKKIERNVEILEAYDAVQSFLTRKKLYEQYREEMEYIVTNNAFIGGSIRVLLVDQKSPVLQKLRDYMDKYYVDYINNRYLKANKMEYLVCRLLRGRHYKIVSILVRLKRKLEGYEV